MLRHHALLLLLVAVSGLAAAEAETPLFSFGIISDIQYADMDPAPPRRYRESLGKLAPAIRHWNARELAFVIELGDIAEGREVGTEQDIQAVLDAFRPLKAPLHHVLGNHPFRSLGRTRVQEMLGVKHPWYDFALAGWRFVILDGLDVSVIGWPKESGPTLKGQAILDAHKAEKRPELRTYNGGIGDAQKAWLAETLARAEAAGEQVIVLCHLPTAPEANKPTGLLWNYPEIAKLIDGCPAVVAYLAGHVHEGGYAFRNGVHHVTLQGLVQTPPDSTAFGIITVFPDRLVIDGQGTLTSRVLPVRKAAPEPAK